FAVTLKTAGTQSLTVTDTMAADLSARQEGIVVNPAAASQFDVADFPSPRQVGAAGYFYVMPRDAFGNRVTTYTGTVHFTSSDAPATLPGNYAFTNGVLTFTATLWTAGTQSLTVTDTASPTITGSQTGIRVIPLASVTGPSAGFRNQTLTFTLGASGMP